MHFILRNYRRELHHGPLGMQFRSIRVVFPIGFANYPRVFQSELAIPSQQTTIFCCFWEMKQLWAKMADVPAQTMTDSPLSNQRGSSVLLLLPILHSHQKRWKWCGCVFELNWSSCDWALIKIISTPPPVVIGC